MTITSNILIVEDDLMHAEMIGRALDSMERPCNVVHLFDARKALDYLQTWGAHHGRILPDIVLLDLQMPHMNGIEFLKSIRADSNLAHLPVIVVSTSDSQLDRDQSRQWGCVAYVTKSGDFAEFSSRLSDAVQSLHDN